MFPPRGQSFVGGHSVDAALDVEERIDASHGLERDRRYLVGGFPLTNIAGNVCQFKELASRIARTAETAGRFCRRVIDFSEWISMKRRSSMRFWRCFG